MKKNAFKLFLAGVFCAFICSSCTDEEGGGAKKYSFWKGDIANKYYALDICGGATGQFSGKPFMVLEYDPISGNPVRCEFGICDFVYTSLPRENPSICLGAIPRPTMYASTFTYADRISLTGVVDLLSNWQPVSGLSDLSGGGVDFYVNTGLGKFHFVRNNVSMWGEIVDEGQTGWGDLVSDTKAFSLLHKFDSNTIAK